MNQLLGFLNFDAKTQDGITNITVWLAMLVYFLFINFFVVPINVPNDPANHMIYLFVLFVPAAVKLVFFSGDPISHSENSEALFFQAQFPDKYIETKFKIGKPLAQHLWFRALDKRASEGEIKRTFQYGFTCRLVYYIRRLMTTFAIVSVIFLIWQVGHAYWRTNHGWAGFRPIWNSFVGISNLEGKAFYIMHVVTILVYLRWANKPTSTQPTGVWARWKEINERHKAWLDQFATLEEFKSYVDPPGSPGTKA
jgi:hypothetical protein